MPNESKQPLTSAEIASLWNLYMDDSLIIQVKKYLIAKSEDNQIRDVQEEAIKISKKRNKEVESILRNDNLPIPVGFGDTDVDIDAPRLYSDIFSLYHSFSRTRYALMLGSTALFLSVRQDVKKLFYNLMVDSSKLNIYSTEVALAKGLAIKSPIVSIPESPHFVQKPSYIGHIIGEQRPLHVVSLSGIFLLLQENILGKAIITGFSQVTHNPEVRKLFLRGAEIGTKHIKIFSKLLSDEDIPISQSPDTMVTDSTTPPFSDKLMMNHIVLVNSLAISDLGLAIGQSQRADIALDFSRILAEDIQFGEDAIQLMIKNGWLEAPPQVLNHKKLVTSGKEK